MPSGNWVLFNLFIIFELAYLNERNEFQIHVGVLFEIIRHLVATLYCSGSVIATYFSYLNWVLNFMSNLILPREYQSTEERAKREGGREGDATCPRLSST